MQNLTTILNFLIEGAGSCESVEWMVRVRHTSDDDYYNLFPDDLFDMIVSRSFRNRDRGVQQQFCTLLDPSTEPF